VRKETEKMFRKIEPTEKWDIYLLALIETLDEMKKLVDQCLSAIQTP